MEQRVTSHESRITRLVWGVLLLLVAIVILPFGWMITVALKPNNAPVFTLPPEWFPTEYWHWENFRLALVDSTQPFGRYFLNTTMIVFFNIIGTLFSCSLAAYAYYVAGRWLETTPPFLRLATKRSRTDAIQDPLATSS